MLIQKIRILNNIHSRAKYSYINICTSAIKLK